jgi:hypothetical protein
VLVAAATFTAVTNLVEDAQLQSCKTVLDAVSCQPCWHQHLLLRMCCLLPFLQGTP